MIPTSDELSTLLQRFFCMHLIQHRDVSPHTVKSYRDTMRLLLLFLSDRLTRPVEKLTMSDLQADHLLAFLDHLEKVRGNGAYTRNQRLAAIRCFLRYAGRQTPDLLPIVQQSLAIPRKQYQKKVLDFLTRQEMEAILEAPSQDTWSGLRDRILFLTMYNTGARVSEIIAVRVGDVIGKRAEKLHICGKGRKERIVPLWRRTSRLLRDWIRHNAFNPESPLFPNTSGDHLSRSGVETRLARAVQKAAVQQDTLTAKGVSPHVLRHTTAMHLLQSGVDLTVIALWLGHESISTTHHYVTADIEMKENALSKLKEPSTRGIRYRPTDKLLSFLESL